MTSRSERGVIELATLRLAALCSIGLVVSGKGDIRELSFPVDTSAEILDGLWAITILAVIIWAAWKRHDKEVDESFSPPE